jgi:hypothetical protein
VGEAGRGVARLGSLVFTLFVIPVAYWLLYANTPGHGIPVSLMDQEAEPAVAAKPNTRHLVDPAYDAESVHVRVGRCDLVKLGTDI